MPFNLHPTLAKDSLLAVKVGSLQIRLMDDSRYFWLIIVPETDATELHQLDSDLSNELWGLVRHLGQKLKDHTRADKINNAAIGNLVPQLHFHVVARHRNDPDWPKPIWGAGKPLPLSEANQALRLATVQSWVGNL